MTETSKFALPASLLGYHLSTGRIRYVKHPELKFTINILLDIRPGR